MRAFLILISIVISLPALAQNKAFQEGEWFKFRVSYSGFLTAGYATLQVDNAMLNGKEVFHVKGYGKNSGLSRIFFKVEDIYESYIDKKRDIPYRFIRDINEGGHTRDIIVDFDHNKKEALVHDRKRDTKKIFSFPEGVQDMLSTFYYLRNNLDTVGLKKGDSHDVDMFYGDESFKFRLKFLRKELIKTKFGDVETLVFRPYVQAGRVFKEKESLTVWISDDDNKIPLKIVADLTVGSIRAELDEFKGLKHSFKILAN